MKRREFLAKSVASAGGLLLGTRLLGAQEAKTGGDCEAHDPVTLGKTQIKMTRVGIGTGMRGGNRQSNHTRMGQEKFNALIRGAYERGVRVFDAADLYGTHPFLATALAGMPRKDYVLTSKIWFRRGGIPDPERPDASVVVERFLKELKTDYIDLVLLHCVTSGNWPTELAGHMNVMEGLKKKGIIRAHGVSCHSLAALEACVNESWVDSVHARINPYGAKMDDKPEKVVPVLQRMHGAGKGVIGMKIIGEGDFRNSDEKRDESVRYVLNLGCVDAMVVGCETVEEVDDLAARVRKAPAVKTSA
ncbi:MAG: hypothetical protein A2Y76_03980 [Planctomycetes bacterium RBG_13_60_9]|nr:MAG: hypothetical protein A2Y76_03980 [Planctomycetes bacterium RBG_13_60_9]